VDAPIDVSTKTKQQHCGSAVSGASQHRSSRPRARRRMVLGTVWGEELAKQMLRDAGFVDVELHDVPIN
jgi:hypothetical protein